MLILRLPRHGFSTFKKIEIPQSPKQKKKETYFLPPPTYPYLPPVSRLVRLADHLLQLLVGHVFAQLPSHRLEILEGDLPAGALDAADEWMSSG